MRALFLVMLVACNAYDTDLGPTPFLCGPNQLCPMGYTCLEDNGKEVCFSDGEGGGSGACTNDAVEPNDTLAMATTTPLDTMKTYSLDNLSICPAGDKDHYALTLQAANEAIEIVVEFGAGGATLRGAILNQGGVPIAIAAAVPGSPTTISARTQNLPASAYYVQVSAPAGEALTTNNYKVTINVTP